ncbi:hypothetical protein [Klebsiella pneumoniae]
MSVLTDVIRTVISGI